jgi:peptide/nickel transport system substrate-binding protein
MSFWRDKNLHPYIPEIADEMLRGRVDRREFLRTATLLGMSASAAYGIAGKLTRGDLIPSANAQFITGLPKGNFGGTLRVSMRVQPMTDPATFDWTEMSNVARQFLEYLFITGPDNLTRPHLCRRWAVSRDLKTWTLFLQQAVKWTNGDEFGADDVLFNFKRWLDPKTGSSNQSLFTAMTTSAPTGRLGKDGKSLISTTMSPGAIEKIDNYTVRLHLNRGELSLPESLYNYPTAIVHHRFEDEGGDLSKNPVGTGPFRLTEFKVGEKAVLQKRKDYWGGEPYLDNIVYVDHGDNAGASLAALASDQVDLVYETPVEQIDVVDRIPNARLFETVTAQTAVARMQVDKKPFVDPRVRTAVRLCQDHEQLLLLAHRARGVAAEDHHVAPVHPDYVSMAAPAQNYRLAKQLLTEAGFANGLDLKIDCRKDPPWEVSLAQALAEMCKPVDIQIKINVMPNAQYSENWDKTPFGLTAWTHRPLGFMVPNLAYRSGAQWNETHYSNPEYDRILDQASSTLEVDKRKQYMVKLQKILQKDAVIAQPFWRSIFAAGNKRVQGYELHPSVYHRLNKVWLA